MPELDTWGSFYSIVGSAAGALIGLQFVVITLIADKPRAASADAAAAFGSPTVAHFCAALFLSAMLRAPWQGITIPAVLWGLVGLGGAVYLAVVTRLMQKQASYKPVLEDWLFHVGLPLAAYAGLGLSSFAASSHARHALFAVGAASLLLLFIGIHNSWDNVAYHVFVVRPLLSRERHRDETNKS